VACLHDAILARTKALKHAPELSFLDIKAAYDSVYRPLLWNDLLCKGAPHQLVLVLQGLFDFNKSRVIVNGLETDEVSHISGLLQGSLLSPILYSVFIDGLPRRLKALGRPGLNTTPIACFLYADDIALVADSSDHMQELLEVCEAHANEYGYAFAPAKCVHIPGTLTSGRVTLQGDYVPQAQNFCYLGITVGPKGIKYQQHATDLGTGFTTSLNLFRSFGFHAYGLRDATKRSIYASFLRPVLEYGLPLITNKAALATLQGLQSKALRYMYSAPPSTSVAALHRLAGIHLVETRHALLRAKWLLRSATAPDSCLISEAWKAFQHSKRAASSLNSKERASLRILPDEDAALKIRAFCKTRCDLLCAPPDEDPLSLPEGTPFQGVSDLVDGFIDRRAAHRVNLWLLRRPFGQPTLCKRCGLHRATLRHMQECTNINVDSLLQERQFRHAASAIRAVAKLCTDWKSAWTPSWSDPAHRRREMHGRPP
jgi:hypothetical protein